MKVALIGCGNISRVHLEAISRNPDLELVAAVDIKLDRAKAVAEKYGVRAYENIDDMLANETPESVHICTPHNLHTPLAIKALEKGINVLVEKPCSVSLHQLTKLREMQRISGKAVGVCFQNRYNDCSQYVKRVVESGELGKVVSVRAFVTWERGEDYYSDDWHGTLEKECGGLMINQAIHTVDLMRYLGGDCTAVTGHISNDHLKGVIEVEDTATLLLEYEQGAKGAFYGTTAFKGNSPVFIEITLENGKLRMEGERLYMLDEQNKITEIGTTQGRECIGQHYWGTGHSVLINDFYDCIEQGKPFSIDAFEGGEALKIVLGAYSSCETGSKVILQKGEI